MAAFSPLAYMHDNYIYPLWLCLLFIHHMKILLLSYIHCTKFKIVWISHLLTRMQPKFFAFSILTKNKWIENNNLKFNRSKPDTKYEWVITLDHCDNMDESIFLWCFAHLVDIWTPCHFDWNHNYPWGKPLTIVRFHRKLMLKKRWRDNSVRVTILNLQMRYSLKSKWHFAWMTNTLLQQAVNLVIEIIIHKYS